ncbi:MAG: RNA polymerase sigma factor [Sedimentisphaerales bacterium]
MLQDKLLIWKFNRGRKEVLRYIYEKYKNDLVTLAAALLTDASSAEDVVHDVFVCFLKSSERFRLTGSLKGYLATCVANNARNRNKARQKHASYGLDKADAALSNSNSPDAAAIFGEEQRQLGLALAQLPYEQREVLLMHSYSDLKFRTIARSLGVSINTVQGRYRYALHKLRSMLDGEVKK